MSIQFKSNPLTDMILFAGVKPSEEALKKDPRLAYLKGDALNQAFDSLKSSYENHVKELKFTPRQYVELVEKNLSYFAKSDTVDKVRKAVAGKLEELSSLRKEEERHSNAIILFFHKLGQLFSGRGFQTLGEYGSQLAQKITSVELKQIIQDFNNLISSDYTIERPDAAILAQRINDLSEEDFESFLNQSFFASKQGPSLKNEKGDLFKSLSSEKQAQLKKSLLKRVDFLNQALDIIKTTEDKNLISSLFTQEFVEKAQNLFIINYEMPKTSSKKNIVLQLIAKVVSHLMNQGKFLDVKLIVELQGSDFVGDLSEEDKKKFSDNIRL